EVRAQRRFEHVMATIDHPRLFPLGDDRSVARRREEPANPGASRADAFGKRSLRYQRVLDLAGDRLPLEFLVFADVAADEVRHLLRPDEHADTKIVDARVVAD